MSIKINIIPPKSPSKQIGSVQGSLNLGIDRDREIEGIGMGVLSDGTPYLNQRGLASLCGVQNAHIGTISSQWFEPDQKPRIARIKAIMSLQPGSTKQPHLEVMHKGTVNFCYPADVCLAVLEYYAFDAGVNVSQAARENFRKLAGSKLKEMIYSQVGYDPSGRNIDVFKKWHERLALNYQSAPRGYFHVFNEANTIFYELIVAGAEIDERFVVDISIGTHWSKHWEQADLEGDYGDRGKYPHRYPQDHPQAQANPHESWCYPISALGEFRRWMQDDYLGGGKFKTYLSNKVRQGTLPTAFAELALTALDPTSLPSPH